MAKVNFTNKVLKLMADLSLQEKDILDTYHNGEYKKAPGGGHSVVKHYQYYGYEIGLFYLVGNNDDVIVTHVWKRKRL